MQDIEQEVIEYITKTTYEAAIKDWAKNLGENGVALYNYRLDHVREVVRISRLIAESVKADIEVVTLGAWLHDMAKPGLGGPHKHGEFGANMAREFLQSRGIDENTIKRVCEVIRMHVGLTLEASLEPIEAQVVWEADKIVKLGMTGFIHFLLNGIIMRPGKTLNDFAQDLEDFIPLATKIANSMHTEMGRSLASERLETLKALSKYLSSELGR